ncbi:BQ5605_C001g00763 [Microbotryum silenes-dioicae]|uniref:BQ5605_C001g00763 protein n=1 Tax=Microbotryum silenes-dioicae TaxID=796604 RepID=A0A2X0M4A9_9BASI|nr:BQ5605_C001g00763 [Microbotryum silenes-dioicae]
MHNGCQSKAFDCNTPRRSAHRSDNDKITGPKYVGLTLDTLQTKNAQARAPPPSKAQAHGPYIDPVADVKTDADAQASAWLWEQVALPHLSLSLSLSLALAW